MTQTLLLNEDPLPGGEASPAPAATAQNTRATMRPFSKGGGTFELDLKTKSRRSFRDPTDWTA